MKMGCSSMDLIEFMGLGTIMSFGGAGTEERVDF